MKSFIKYPGGKGKELELVENFKPKKIERYFEPFLGGGSIFFGLNEKNNFLNDFSNDLMTVYKLIKTDNEEFYYFLNYLNFVWKEVEKENLDLDIFKHFNYNKYISYFEKSKQLKEKKLKQIEKEKGLNDFNDWKKIIITAKKTAIYMIVRDIYNEYNDDVFHYACFYFLREYCYSSMFRFSKKGRFNVPYGGRSYDYKYLDAKIEYMKNEIFIKLQNVQLYNLDFEEFLNSFDLNEKDFVFLDPPYDSEFSTYDKNIFDKNEQKRLNDVLKRTKAKWMLIIKKTDFIYELYKGFNIVDYDFNYSVSFKNRNLRDVKHLLITNYKTNKKKR